MPGIAGVVGDLAPADGERAVRAMLTLTGTHGELVRTWQLGAHGRTIVLGQAARHAAFALAGPSVLVLDGEVHDLAALEPRHDGSTPAAAVLLAALQREGPKVLARCNGEWSIAWLDGAAGTLLLARDHLGARSLYLHADARALWFGSEPRAILAGTGAPVAVDAVAAARYLEQTLLDVDERTMFAGIRRLPAHHVLALDVARPTALPAPVAYWRMPAVDPSPVDVRERVHAIGALLEDSVRRRCGGPLRACVLLSGGVDSSTVAALATKVLPDIGLVSGVSRDARYYDPLLDSVCVHLDRTAQRVALGFDAGTALSALGEAIARDGEPVRSFITLTEYRLKQGARDFGFDAVLSGLGADEVFAGNLVHLVFFVQDLLAKGRWLAAARTVLAALLRRTLRLHFRRRVQKRYFPKLAGRRASVAGPLLRDHVRVEVALGSRSADDRLRADVTELSLPWLLHLDQRGSSANGLSTRLPYLDHRLVELVAPLAAAAKLRGGTTKWLLRSAAANVLPREVVWRKIKQGRTDAYGEWLKRDMLAPIAQLLRGELASADLGLLDAGAVRAQYEAFCAQPPDRGLVSAQDVFAPIALELWTRALGGQLRGGRQ